MANTNTPRESRLKGWFFDQVNGRLEAYYNGTKVFHLNASGFSITDDTTARMTNGALTSSGLGAGVVGISAASAILKQHVGRLGTTAAIASNGSDAILPDVGFVAPANLVILSAWKLNMTASDVTKGTATTSASYRRFNLIVNTAGTGSGTTIVASMNATASLASLVTRAFAADSTLTVPAGAILLCSHLTVGAATADGTDAAAAIFEIAYQYV